MQRLPARFDAARLDRLLELVGPAAAPDLLGQLAADLDGCAATIARAAPPRDWPELRNASHVLMSLAGSTGAQALADLAQALNATAQGQDPAALDHLMADLDAELSALITLIRSMAEARTAR